jgi:hypothetical protein
MDQLTNINGEVRHHFNSSTIRTMKGHTYFSTYERYFKHYKNLGRKVKFLEIGIWNGGSIDLWKKYFEDNIELHMIDINNSCLKLNYRFPDVHIHIGDQSDSSFLKRIIDNYGTFDIILDDGGHTMTQQNISFNVLFQYVNPGGIYICEDLHTSYWKSFGGAYLREGTFIETIKRKIDELNAYQSEDGRLIPNYFTKNCSGIYTTASMVVFEKSRFELGKVMDICAGYEEL